MVLTCLDESFGSGLFPQLHLTHVIPASRLECAYQLRLARDIGLFYGRLVAMRDLVSFKRRLLARARAVVAWLGINHRGGSRRLETAFHMGYCRGLAEPRRIPSAEDD